MKDIERKYQDHYLPYMWALVEKFCNDRNMDIKSLFIEHIVPTQNHVEFSYRYNHDAVLLVFSKEGRQFKLTGWDIVLPEAAVPTNQKENKIMSKTLDIRDKIQVPENIKFDDSDGRILKNSTGLEVLDEDHDEFICCDWENLDDFIKAAKKAKELWYNNQEA